LELCGSFVLSVVAICLRQTLFTVSTVSTVFTVFTVFTVAFSDHSAAGFHLIETEIHQKDSEGALDMRNQQAGTSLKRCCLKHLVAAILSAMARQRRQKDKAAILVNTVKNRPAPKGE
jgi:hypothetical protein